MKTQPDSTIYINIKYLKQKHRSAIISFSLLLPALLFVCLFQGCGPGIQGHGIVLWAEKDTGIKNGDIVKILSESLIQDAFIVYKDNPKERITLKQWRLEVLKTKKEAEAFAVEYAPYSSMYAYSEKDGVPPVRESPDSSSGVKIISKPKAYQVLKVLKKIEEAVTIEDMTDYWYQVLIEYQGIGADGEYKLLGDKGYCFGHLLKVFQTDKNPEDMIQKNTKTEDKEDPLDNFLTIIWRPEYFSDMINSGRLDLDQFKSSIGLFPEPGGKKIIISLPDGYYEFDYTDISRIRYYHYLFQGADLRIEIISTSRVSVTYMADGEQVNELFLKINSNIDVLVEREKEIRDALYEDFYLRGQVLTSSAYGTIVLKEDKTFTWTGFDKLIPAVIPHDITGSGRIDFPHYISSTLKENYDGVITFYFRGYSPDAGTNFLFKKTEKGARFFYVKEELIKNRQVIKTDLNPMVIFFTFSEG